MCAVPKVSANYLEALERWDTGAVQCFCALAIGRPWFWATSLWMLSLMGVMLAPAWIRIDVTSFESWAEVVNSIANYRANPGPLVICVAAGFMLLYMLAGITLIASTGGCSTTCSASRSSSSTSPTPSTLSPPSSGLSSRRGSPSPAPSPSPSSPSSPSPARSSSVLSSGPSSCRPKRRPRSTGRSCESTPSSARSR